MDRSASKDEVKRAYRRRARETHPDTGGSEAQFQRVALAARVLSDDEARSRYDATGSTDAPQDMTEQEAMNIIDQTLAQVLNQPNIEFYDVVDLMRQHIKAIRAKVQREAAAAKSQGDAMAKMATRFTCASERNPIGNMLAARIEGHRRAEQQLGQMLKCVDRAIEIMISYSFERRVVGGTASNATAQTSTFFNFANGALS